MATQWGRKETVVWQPHMPIYSYTAIAGALLCAILFLWESYAFQQAPLQKAYIAEYIRTTFGAQANQHGNYRLVTLAGPSVKPRLALPGDFESGTTLMPGGVSLPVALSPATRAEGYDLFYRAPARRYSDKSLHRWFRDAIFGGKSAAGAYSWPLGEGALVLILALAYAVREILRG